MIYKLLILTGPIWLSLHADVLALSVLVKGTQDKTPQKVELNQT